LAKSLVYVFEKNNKMIDLILTFIEIELASGDHNTVFRQNSLATKMFKFYSRMIGIEYLFNTLARYVAELEVSSRQKDEGNELISTTIEMEVDPSKMTEAEDENVNTLQLMLVVQKIFNAILKSANAIPIPLLGIITHVRRIVNQSMPGKNFEYTAMSSFFFLRYVCPSIAAPHAYGLLPNPPNASVQRQLVLLSKVLQNLGNGLRFGKKEEFMAKLNHFIDENITPLYKFYDSLAEVSGADLQVEPHEIPDIVFQNSIVWIHNHIAVNEQKLFKDLESNKDFDNGLDVKRQVTEVLQVLGTPADRNAKARQSQLKD